MEKNEISKRSACFHKDETLLNRVFFFSPGIIYPDSAGPMFVFHYLCSKIPFWERLAYNGKKDVTWQVRLRKIIYII